MAFNLVYSPEAALVGGAALEAGEAGARERRDVILDEREAELQNFYETQRRYNLDLGERRYNTDLQSSLAREQMALRVAGLQQQAFQNSADQQLRAYLGQQRQLGSQQYMQGQLALQQGAQQNAMERAKLQAATQIARDEADRNMKMAMADRHAIEDFQGWRDQEQKQEAVASWENKYGMGWSTPVEMAEADQLESAREKALTSLRGFFASGDEQILSDEELDMFVDVNPDTGMPVIDWAGAQKANKIKLDIAAQERLNNAAQQQHNFKQELAEDKAVRDEEMEKIEAEISRQQALLNKEEDFKAKIIMDAASLADEKGNFDRDAAEQAIDFQLEQWRRLHPSDAEQVPNPVAASQPQSASDDMIFADMVPTPKSRSEIKSYPVGTVFFYQDKTYRKTPDGFEALL